MPVRFTVNGREASVEVPEDTPLLWVLRDALDLTGTKYGCGRGLCGACTVHLDGEPVTACTISVSRAAGRDVTTIEGLSEAGDHPVQRAWIEEDVPQCGYCQPGQIMAAAGLLRRIPDPSEEEIASAMAGNLCRCGTYPRIRAAIRSAARSGGTRA